jgi:hypothetical protein
VSVSYFYEPLAPYGSWVEYPHHGWCWVPHVSSTWRPYTYGRWEYTEFGWTWVSYDPWGWAVSDRHLLDRNLRARVVPPQRNASFLLRTRNAMRYAIRDGAPVNHGVGIDVIQRAVGGRVKPLRSTEIREPGRPREIGRGRIGNGSPGGS